MEELALVQWVKNDAKNFVLSAYKKTKNWVKGGWKEGLSMGLDFLPIVGNIKASYESAYGKDPITGRKLSTAERAIAGAAIIGGPLVKGAKHLGKGALKIIPGSDKLVQGVSKSFTKVKEGGKQIIDKVTVKAKELKAEANVMMAKAKQGIQEQMDHLGGLLRRNDPIPATAGGPPVKNMPVRDRDSTVQRSTGNSSGAGGSVKDADKAGTTPRYGERQISDEEYNMLRRQTLTQKLRDKVNEGHNKKTVTQDEALPGKTFKGALEADHIVSMDRIASMDGFGKLTETQKLEILNNPENFTGLSKSANTSKQSKSYEEWTHYKKGKPGEIEVNPEFRERMMVIEKELERKIQKQIDDFNELNKKGDN
ncbi:pre-toxin TG domain-containing protein [Metasolibacillus meyeri]|uniref:Pre-toxin TG domain-containing protein n=1 Tax=Metasolibacillus meyeri TaxID=1071052 RepID=A0AAW9NXV8_9BACL|nr:pre-toxin TG domain-containing protein [Metasolibacillus meyeri]MEC1180063.1 pre-toxin TG domain-containing protein [Metasolibacillus meyeri]